MSKESELFESWSIDYPLQEITMEMANYPLPVIDDTTAPKHRRSVDSPSNGKPKAATSKPRKKKPTHRRKS